MEGATKCDLISSLAPLHHMRQRDIENGLQIDARYISQNPVFVLSWL